MTGRLPSSVSEIAPGLLRWTTPHPDWRPGAVPEGPDDWEQLVGCVVYELPGTVALVDPLLASSERERFLDWLDGRIGERAVSILTRYRSSTTRAWDAVPAGVEPRPLRGAGETLFWLPAVATLVCGDAVQGAAGGGLRLCPESWLEDMRVDRAGLAALLSVLLELPIERVLVSHGAPVLRDGRAALARAISEARPEGRR
jgi:hypothetical protein